MLSINNNVILHSDHREHAWALRTIGQDLAEMRPEYLEVEFTGGFYIARGRTRTSAANASRAGKILDGLRRLDRRAQGQVRESSWFERRYSLYDVNRLDENGLIQRKDRPISPDIYVLAERLRTVGKLIEAKHGQLLKLTLDNNRIAFTFRDDNGEVYKNELSAPELYRTQQDGNRSRGTGRTRDPWSIFTPRSAAPANASIKGKFRLVSERTPKRSRQGEEDEM
jgi:hypothetical protein